MLNLDKKVKSKKGKLRTFLKGVLERNTKEKIAPVFDEPQKTEKDSGDEELNASTDTPPDSPSSHCINPTDSPKRNSSRRSVLYRTLSGKIEDSLELTLRKKSDSTKKPPVIKQLDFSNLSPDHCHEPRKATPRPSRTELTRRSAITKEVPDTPHSDEEEMVYPENKEQKPKFGSLRNRIMKDKKVMPFGPEDFSSSGEYSTTTTSELYTDPKSESDCDQTYWNKEEERLSQQRFLTKGEKKQKRRSGSKDKNEIKRIVAGDEIEFEETPPFKTSAEEKDEITSFMPDKDALREKQKRALKDSGLKSLSLSQYFLEAFSQDLQGSTLESEEHLFNTPQCFAEEKPIDRYASLSNPYKKNKKRDVIDMPQVRDLWRLTREDLDIALAAYEAGEKSCSTIRHLPRTMSLNSDSGQESGSSDGSMIRRSVEFDSLPPKVKSESTLRKETSFKAPVTPRDSSNISITKTPKNGLKNQQLFSLKNSKIPLQEQETKIEGYPFKQL